MGDKNVNVELYEFLMENETGLFGDRTNDYQVTAYVRVRFDDLSNFSKIIGCNRFDDGDMDVKLMDGTVCIDINEIIEGEGHSLVDYKNCFENSDWEYHERQIIEEWE
jgi:hypothetical protein